MGGAQLAQVEQILKTASPQGLCGGERGTWRFMDIYLIIRLQVSVMILTFFVISTMAILLAEDCGDL